MSEPSRTYRKSISDAEKFEKETDERSGDARDTGDTRTSRVADEKLRKLNRNELVRETGCSPVNVFTSKIKRKRISRGVQCVSIGCRSSTGRSLLSCFKSKSGKHSLTRKAKRKKAAANKFDVGPRNEVNRSPDTTTVNDESHKVIKEEIKSMSDTDTKKEKFEKIGEEKIERIIYGNDRELLVRIQNINDVEKSKDNADSKDRKVKINLLDKLRLRKALTCRNDSKAQQNGSRHESRNHKEEIVGFSFENKRANGGHKREDNSQSTKIVDREIDSSNGWKSASADRGNINKIKERLDLCIVELNEIISDACVIFGNRKNTAKNNDRGC